MKRGSWFRKPLSDDEYIAQMRRGMQFWHRWRWVFFLMGLGILIYMTWICCKVIHGMIAEGRPQDGLRCLLGFAAGTAGGASYGFILHRLVRSIKMALPTRSDRLLLKLVDAIPVERPGTTISPESAPAMQSDDEYVARLRYVVRSWDGWQKVFILPRLGLVVATAWAFSELFQQALDLAFPLGMEFALGVTFGMVYGVMSVGIPFELRSMVSRSDLLVLKLLDAVQSVPAGAGAPDGSMPLIPSPLTTGVNGRASVVVRGECGLPD